MLTWKVKNFDMNKRAIIDYDVFKYTEPEIKKLKKESATKEEFAEALKFQLRWRYWCRSEFELIITIKDDRVYLMPWSGCREPEKATIDMTDDTSFDWLTFAKKCIDRQVFKDKAKIDIWDQLSFKIDELVDYCWYTHLPYERRHEKYERK